jgi:hypothetical protein
VDEKLVHAISKVCKGSNETKGNCESDAQDLSASMVYFLKSLPHCYFFEFVLRIGKIHPFYLYMICRVIDSNLARICPVMRRVV